MKIYQVDSFTNKAFMGNPAAVCMLEEQMSDSLLQSIASEMNLSETAFILKNETGFDLRWFTPRIEVELCGHATLAAAHILFENRLVPQEEAIEFVTKSGILIVKKDANKLIMDFPQKYLEAAICPQHIKDALGIEPLYTMFDGKRYLIEIADEHILKNMKPDFTVLEKEYFGFMLTARSRDANYDFVSRFFAPCVGINEDPVTGSAHSYLAPYWAAKLNKQKLTGYQVSERTGVIECELIDDNRVLLKGEAVTVFTGKLHI